LGLQVIGKPKGEAMLFAQCAWLESLLEGASLTPIDPR